jgi:hypothetical protein
MKKNKLYRLMDVLDEIKQVDEILSVHSKKSKTESTLMLSQYKAKKEKLLVYFINELNSSPEHRPSRLAIIKKMMERYYPSSKSGKVAFFKQDQELSQLEEAI